MNHTRTLAFSVATQGVGAALNLFTLPLVARQLGAEAFGLIGLGLTVQAWLMSIDGCNLMSRFAAEGRAQPGAQGAGATAARIYAAAERVYGVVGLLVLATVALLIAGNGMSLRQGAQSLDGVTLACALLLIAASAVGKLMASFYRGANIGMADMDYTNVVSLCGYVLRFLVAYLLLFVWPSVTVYLLVQLVSFVAEAAAMRHRFTTRHAPGTAPLGWRSGVKLLRGQQELVGATLFVATLLTAAGQLDKTILLGVLPLRDYGTASVAIMLCAGIFVAATPVLQVFLPGLMRDAQHGQPADGQAFFRMMLIMTTLGVGTALLGYGAAAPLAALLAPSMQGDVDLMRRAFIYYGIGNGLAVMGQSFYWLHLASGTMQVYRRMAVVHLGAYFALLLLLARGHGLDGAGWAWMAGNAGLLAMLAAETALRRTRHQAGSLVLGSALAALVVGLLAMMGLSEWAASAFALHPVLALASVLALAALVVGLHVGVVARGLKPRIAFVSQAQASP